MTDKPKQSAGIGNVATRFKPGNRASVGHGGGAGKAAKLRAVIQAAVSEKDMRAIIKAQIVLALGGDTVAAKFVCDYSGCKPIEQAVVTTLQPGDVLPAATAQLLSDPGVRAALLAGEETADNQHGDTTVPPTQSTGA